jgi:hypothetical protein
MRSEHRHNQGRIIPFPRRRRPVRLIACSVCLRVREGAAWMEPGDAIRRLRTFEHEHVVRLGGALCDRCQTELELRRRSGSEDLAA